MFDEKEWWDDENELTDNDKTYAVESVVALIANATARSVAPQKRRSNDAQPDLIIEL